MALDPPVLALPFLQLLHALSFGATHLGALAYVAACAGAARRPPRKAISRSRRVRAWRRWRPRCPACSIRHFRQRAVTPRWR